MIVRPGRVEDAVSGLLAVHVELAVTESTDECRGPEDGFPDFELLPEIDGVSLNVLASNLSEEDVPFGAELPRGPHADPDGLPFRPFQETGFKKSRLAPRAFFALRVPPPDLPPVSAAAEERLSVIGDMEVPVRLQPVRIPLVAGPAPAEIHFGADEDPAGGLGFAPFRAFEEPGKPRPGHVDAQRVPERLAFEGGWGGRGHDVHLTGPGRGSNRTP